MILKLYKLLKAHFDKKINLTMELIIGKLKKGNISSQNQEIIFNNLNHSVLIRYDTSHSKI